MEPVSRTPEGKPNTCPVCGAKVTMEPSMPAGDAPCPNCGTLLWFVKTDHGLHYFDDITLARKVALENDIRPSRRQLAQPEVHSDKIAVGDQIWIKGGTFEGFSGMIASIDQITAIARIDITIFGRTTTVDVHCSDINRAE